MDELTKLKIVTPETTLVLGVSDKETVINNFIEINNPDKYTAVQIMNC